MTLDLRPLTLAELLDRSFSTYKRHLWLFVGIMAVPAALAMVTAILLRLFNIGLNPATPPEQMLRKMVPLFIGSFVFGISYLLVYMFALGATTVAVSQIYLGHETAVGASYQRGEAARRSAGAPDGRRLAAAVWHVVRPDSRRRESCRPCSRC